MSDLTYQFFSFISFQYIIPISVILVTHTQIIGIVRQRTQAATSFRHSNRADVTIRKNRKTTQILLIIALMFGAHWLPYHIYTIGECFSCITKAVANYNVRNGRVQNSLHTFFSFM